MNPEYRTINPAILYFGTPVVLVSTLNEDGTPNLAPISSAFWLGYRCVIGMIASSQSTINLLRTKQCVLNLPSDDMVDNVNGIARTTGTKNIPADKLDRGYTYLHDKFGGAKLDPLPSEVVDPPRAGQCPVQMEAELVVSHGIMDEHPLLKNLVVIMEVKILRIHAKENILVDGREHKIDPDKWKPLIMSFQKFYGLTDRVGPSVLARIDEEHYRGFTDQPNKENTVNGLEKK